MPESPLTDAGYQDLRDYIESTWRYVELRGPDGGAIARIDIQTDDRARWLHAAGANPLVAEIILSGDDAEVNVPETVDAAALYRVEAGGEAFHEQAFDVDAVLGTVNDEITVTYSIEEPDL